MESFEISPVESLTDATEPLIIECVDGMAFGPYAALLADVIRYYPNATECYVYADGTVDAFSH
jgi:hypothetical protein